MKSERIIHSYIFKIVWPAYYTILLTVYSLDLTLDQFFHENNLFHQFLDITK